MNIDEACALEEWVCPRDMCVCVCVESMTFLVSFRTCLLADQADEVRSMLAGLRHSLAYSVCRSCPTTCTSSCGVPFSGASWDVQSTDATSARHSVASNFCLETNEL